MFISQLPKEIYTVKQVRELECIAIKEMNISGFTLMERAGQGAFELFKSRWPEAKLTVFCGSGNNAGDGYIVAALAQQQHHRVRVVQMADQTCLKGDALTAYQKALEAGVPMLNFSEMGDMQDGVVIDALLGTGFYGELKESFFDAIQFINGSGLPVLALDIPSGLNADTGAISNNVINASVTLTFIGVKPGLTTAHGLDCRGDIYFDALHLSSKIYTQVANHFTQIDFNDYSGLFSERPQQSHKGNFGHVIVVGGDLGLGGAVLMAAEAAQRVGAGLVSVATRGAHVSAILARRPELMVKSVDDTEAIDEMLERASVIVVGPGLGQSAWSTQLLGKVLTSSVPIVIDADGLNLLAQLSLVGKDNWLMTPHPGEMSRLLGQSISAVQCDRFAALKSLHEKYNCHVMLKGAGSLIYNKDDATIGICTSGNPGMSTGGMGDVLSGVIAGLLAQGFSPDAALNIGVCLHSAAGDIAGEKGERGMLASDLYEPLRQLVNVVS